MARAARTTALATVTLILAALPPRAEDAACRGTPVPAPGGHVLQKRTGELRAAIYPPPAIDPLRPYPDRLRDRTARIIGEYASGFPSLEAIAADFSRHGGTCEPSGTGDTLTCRMRTYSRIEGRCSAAAHSFGGDRTFRFAITFARAGYAVVATEVEAMAVIAPLPLP